MKILTRGFLLLLLLAIAVPLGWVLLSSVKPGVEILGHPWSLPTELAWRNYGRAWREAGIGRAFLNSVLVVIFTLGILIPVGSMAAYVLAKYTFPLRRTIHAGFLAGMMFPHLLVVVPLFLLLRDLKLLDTLTGLVLVYAGYSLSFTIFVLTGFFESLPDELREAAEIDGCGHAGIFWRVMLPLARPGVLVVAIFNAIGLWNEYALALVLLPSPANATLPLGIANLTVTQQYQADWGALFAGLVIVMLPVLGVYWTFRERIHETMLAGAIKG